MCMEVTDAGKGRQVVRHRPFRLHRTRRFTQRRGGAEFNRDNQSFCFGLLCGSAPRREIISLWNISGIASSKRIILNLTSMNLTRGEFTLSWEPAAQQSERIHAYLTRSYWAEGIS